MVISVDDIGVGAAKLNISAQMCSDAGTFQLNLTKDFHVVDGRPNNLN